MPRKNTQSFQNYFWIFFFQHIIITCSRWDALQVDQRVHVSPAQPLRVGLFIANTNEANSGVFKDQVGALVALRVKHPEARIRVAAKICLQENIENVNMLQNQTTEVILFVLL